MSSGAPPEAPVVLFVDRSLGRRIVPNALRAAGVYVIAHDERFGEGTKDTEWLAMAGQEGWVALTKDARIRYKPNELEALKESGALVIVVTAGNATGTRLAEIVVKALPRILQVAASARRPAAFSLGASGNPRPIYPRSDPGEK